MTKRKRKKLAELLGARVANGFEPKDGIRAEVEILPRNGLRWIALQGTVDAIGSDQDGRWFRVRVGGREMIFRQAHESPSKKWKLSWTASGQEPVLATQRSLM